MLEDFTMEKKPSNRSVQTPSKGSGTEVKKAQDTTGNVGKQFPRQSRRREPPGPKWDQNRRSFPQKQNKTTNYDNKRPKPRGQQLYYGCGKANTQVVDELTEQFGLVATSPNGGSKKQSLNHLLNFHYAPRGDVSSSSLSSSHHRYGSLSSSGSARWLMSTHKHKYNKEQFLQANCQFVVRSDGDYSAYMGDPDMLVNWDMIEQIRVASCEQVNCPICLSTPVAGKITRCGHVFCWSCMLHYLALSDKSWRKCPICYESVHRQDLKSVEILLRPTYSTGEEITFRLMKRERGSLIASPVSQYDARTSYGLLSVDEDKLDVIYSKLLTADIEQVSAIIDKEKKELEAQMRENEGCPELCFIEQAVELLNQRKSALTTRHALDEDKFCDSYNDEGASTVGDNTKSAIVNFSSNNFDDQVNKSDKREGNAGELQLDLEIQGMQVEDGGLVTSLSSPCVDSYGDLLVSSPDEISDNSFVVDGYDVYSEATACALENLDSLCGNPDSSERCRYISASSTSEGEDGVTGIAQLTAITAEDLEISSIPSCTNSGGNKHFYFYQAQDGQQLFLHAVNVRMLEMSYGSLENSPPLITGAILEKESGSMTDELRKRLRYLQHLPVTCQFEVAEINLKPPLITPDTLEFYRDQLETRRKRREKRARDERRREKKMVEQVHRQYGGGPAPRLRIESLHHFPQCGSELTATVSSGAVPSTPSSAGRDSPVVQSSPSSSRASSPVSVMSSSPPSSATGLSFAQMLRDGKSSGGGGAWHSNPWPRSNNTTSSVSRTVQNDSDNDCNPSAAPHYRQSFSDAISTALEQAALLHDKDEPEKNSGGVGKKKKRKQKVLLFATGMACNSK